MMVREPGGAWQPLEHWLEDALDRRMPGEEDTVETLAALRASVARLLAGLVEKGTLTLREAQEIAVNTRRTPPTLEVQGGS